MRLHFGIAKNIPELRIHVRELVACWLERGNELLFEIGCRYLVNLPPSWPHHAMFVQESIIWTRGKEWISTWTR